MLRETPNLFSDSTTGSPVTAHCDGGARGNPGPAGYGAVVTDASGAVLAELSEYLGRRTNNYAEYSGLLGVLAWALEHQRLNLRVVSDSELMVKQIQGKYKVNSADLRPLWQQARERIAQFDRFEITHALRHKNKDADRLANEAMDRGMGKAGGGSAVRQAASQPAVLPRVASRQEEPRETTSPQGLAQAAVADARPTMLRGFVRGGAVHLLGNATLPDGIFVKVMPE